MKVKSTLSCIYFRKGYDINNFIRLLYYTEIFIDKDFRIKYLDF